MDWNSNMMQMMRPYSAASDFVEKMQRLRSNSTYLVVVVSLSFFTVSQKSEWIYGSRIFSGANAYLSQDLLAYGVVSLAMYQKKNRRLV